MLMQEMQVRPLSWADPVEKEMATHSSILAWDIAWTEEPGRLHTVNGVAKEWVMTKVTKYKCRCCMINHVNHRTHGLKR